MRKLTGSVVLLLAACAGGAKDRSFEANLGGNVEPSPGGEGAPGTFPSDAGLAADAAFESCATSVVEAKRERAPVDIVWLVDNSSSMEPAVAAVQSGLNNFANLVGAKGLDYQVIMLSLRGVGLMTVGGKDRHPVCVPPPLGGAACGNAARFFHASLDVKSTQPLEQLLGTMDQTAGYRMGDERGSEPWSQVLRAGATKTFVVVTDDESRLSATDFETFPGGPNPNNANLVLPPGLLDPSRGGAMAGYVLSAIYGWGSATDPTVKCTYPGGGAAQSAGPTYTQLVTKTGGARAHICDGSGAWSTFFDAVATAVEVASRVACDLPIPAPTDGGTIDPEQVNVRIGSVVPRVGDATACGAANGWYYDDRAAPTKVILCPTACEAAQVKGSLQPKTELVFGCKTTVR